MTLQTEPFDVEKALASLQISTDSKYIDSDDKLGYSKMKQVHIYSWEFYSNRSSLTGKTCFHLFNRNASSGLRENVDICYYIFLKF